VRAGCPSLPKTSQKVTGDGLKGQIPFDVGHEYGDSDAAEILGQYLKGDRFSGAGGTCNESVAIRHPGQQIDGFGGLADQDWFHSCHLWLPEIMT